jgi:hypothetical protein
MRRPGLERGSLVIGLVVLVLVISACAAGANPEAGGVGHRAPREHAGIAGTLRR